MASLQPINGAAAFNPASCASPLDWLTQLLGSFFGTSPVAGSPYLDQQQTGPYLGPPPTPATPAPESEPAPAPAPSSPSSEPARMVRGEGGELFMLIPVERASRILGVSAAELMKLLGLSDD